MGQAEELYDELIGPIEEKMMGTVARIVGDPDDADDVFQEVLATVWKKLPRIHRHPNPHGYIIRICVTRSYDALRRRSRRRRRERPLNPKHACAGHGANPVGQSERDAAIRHAMASLPTKQGQAVYLRLVEGESYEAIAAALGCSEPTARSNASKGRARLRVLLAEVVAL